ncbi:MAG: hypothetical protein H6744_02680 [Deltaproteobacteria bacterium]|nr:hypothetical protein [Deltaproteobacteria bacterium]MCB9785578.1 hypothetical protein [Deltaproteobacteria bacterium]
MRAALALVAASLAVWPSLSCDQVNSMFAGLWRSTLPAASGPFAGAPELAIGHYGREIAGVAYFKIVQGGSEYVAECPCAFIENKRVDLDARTVDFATKCDDLQLDWSLTLREEGTRRLLEGTVTRADGGPGSAEVQLERDDEFVRDEDKLCPPASP